MSAREHAQRASDLLDTPTEASVELAQAHALTALALALTGPVDGAAAFPLQVIADGIYFAAGER